MSRSQWYDFRADEWVEFDPIQPGEVIVTDPAPSGLLGPDGALLPAPHRPFGFQRSHP